MRSLTTALTLFGLIASANPPAQEEAAAPALRDDLAVYHRPVTTASTGAQAYFDQGLVLAFGFHHEAAVAAFARAAELDTSCAMAWWGRSISLGPNINNPHMEDDAAEGAWKAAQRAMALSEGASAVEKDLIRAIGARYAWPRPEDQSVLDTAYADGMRKVWKDHPGDADVGALFAEALMNLRPWDLWSQDGEPRPETPEVMAALETVMAMVPDHPLACHLYIHTMEASPFPEKAAAAADVLRDRVPGAGHLIHMPAHIDIRLGRYKAAMTANRKAIEVDRSWASQGGFYTMYRAHNFHFLAFAAMFDGQRDAAMKAAREMIEQVPLEIVRDLPDFLDGFIGVPIHVMVRFGLWDEILAEPRPPEDLVVTTAFWRYGRTVAFSALGRVEEAAAEFALLKEAYDAVPESRLIGNNTARTVLEVGLPIAEGELAYRRGNHDEAFDLLREAVRRDVALKYDEPWGWMMPVRHALGALLTEQGRLEEAEGVYRADLEIHPDNGWALHGLAECLRRTGRAEEARAAAERFASAWSSADVDIKGSCYCRTQSAGGE
jgi:tetratricopeptide (TPR) repeat protein